MEDVSCTQAPDLDDDKEVLYVDRSKDLEAIPLARILKMHCFCHR
jgi:hypothetical protein